MRVIPAATICPRPTAWTGPWRDGWPTPCGRRRWPCGRGTRAGAYGPASTVDRCASRLFSETPGDPRERGRGPTLEGAARRRGRLIGGRSRAVNGMSRSGPNGAGALVVASRCSDVPVVENFLRPVAVYGDHTYRSWRKSSPSPCGRGLGGWVSRNIRAGFPSPKPPPARGGGKLSPPPMPEKRGRRTATTTPAIPSRPRRITDRGSPSRIPAQLRPNDLPSRSKPSRNRPPRSGHLAQDRGGTSLRMGVCRRGIATHPMPSCWHLRRFADTCPALRALASGGSG